MTHKLSIKTVPGKITVQLKQHGESEIARLSEIVRASAHVCSASLGNIQFRVVSCYRRLSFFSAEILLVFDGISYSTH